AARWPSAASTRSCSTPTRTSTSTCWSMRRASCPAPRARSTWPRSPGSTPRASPSWICSRPITRWPAPWPAGDSSLRGRIRFGRRGRRFGGGRFGGGQLFGGRRLGSGRVTVAGAQGLALGRAGGLGHVALAGAAQRRLGPGTQVRLQLALGRPIDGRVALLARDLDRLLVLQEVDAGLATPLGRPDLTPALLAVARALLVARRWRRGGVDRRRVGGPVGRCHGLGPGGLLGSLGRGCLLRRPIFRLLVFDLLVFGRFVLGRLVGELRLWTDAGRELGLLGPGPGPLAVLGLAGDLPVLELAHLLGADLAVLRVRIAGLATHRARQLRAALVEPGALAAGTAAGALDVLQRLVDLEAALAHAARRLGSRLAGHALVQLIAARPGPGVLAAGGPAPNLPVGDAAEFGLARLAHPARWLVREAGRVGLDLLVAGPGPLVLAAVDAAGDGAVLQLAKHALALRAAQRRRFRRDVGRSGQQLGASGERRRARAALDRAGERLVAERAQLLFAAGAQAARGRLLGGCRFELRHRTPGPGAVAARAVARALRVLHAPVQLAAWVAHRRRRIRRVGEASAAQLGGLTSGDGDPGARAPRHRTGRRLGAQAIGKRKSGETHDGVTMLTKGALPCKP